MSWPGSCTCANKPTRHYLHTSSYPPLARDWWSEELGAWASQQRIYGKAFKKPTSQRSESEKTYASKTTERRVALLDGIGFFT